MSTEQNKKRAGRNPVSRVVARWAPAPNADVIEARQALARLRHLTELENQRYDLFQDEKDQFRESDTWLAANDRVAETMGRLAWWQEMKVRGEIR